MDQEQQPVETDEAPRKMSDYISMGVLIALGAGTGMIIGILVDQFVMGMAIGAGLGTVAGAIFESRRKR